MTTMTSHCNIGCSHYHEREKKDIKLAPAKVASVFREREMRAKEYTALMLRIDRFVVVNPGR